ncbi:phosphoribosyltransferase [Actinoplanes sp. Pm04-4]|uniref:Phosphoribosyltransferase n=1 Tax=Paractinoplanes pyxinae TaxID=2997416 RepID=A0ABT4B6A7_9ACTN|nr:phosphoribosyltransferase [Actinoplanes pyxinae]MCY1141567.1 phosphoribosyltransferase [Actinoplanes pyxinae]
MTTTDQWSTWAIEQHVVRPVATSQSCDLCFGAVGYRSDGIPFQRCNHCDSYPRALDTYVPICSSLDDGLESLLHRYKDFGVQYRWMAAPLTSLLKDFLERHLPCLEARSGRLHVATIVPSGNDGRAFDHLRDAIRLIDDWPIRWTFDLIGKAKSGRPERGVIDPTFYRAGQAAPSGIGVLLVDDTWTSGSTLISAAMCLRGRGLPRIAGLTIGRQLHAGFGNSEQLIDQVTRTQFDMNTCALER